MTKLGVAVDEFGPGKMPDEWHMGDFMLVSAGVGRMAGGGQSHSFPG